MPDSSLRKPDSKKSLVLLGHQGSRAGLAARGTVLRDGTLAGSLLLALADPTRTAGEWCAVGAGMGYYSLSSVLIGEYRGPELGTLALLANIARELLALLVAPLWYRLFGRLAPIAVAGATSMDTALPVCVRYAGRDYASLAIYHGFVTDASVFFLVTLFVG